MAQNRPVDKQESTSPLSALQSNAAAVRAVASAVEGTLGPRGLNCMLVDGAGDVTITNDGSTILTHIDAHHPAARILIRAARSQDDEVGDGTTTAAILAAALIAEGAEHVARGVPVSMLVEGIREGICTARSFIAAQSHPCADLESAALRQCVLISARGETEIAQAVLEAGQIYGSARLLDPDFQLRDSVTVVEGAQTRAFAGVLIDKDRMNRQMPTKLAGVRCLVLADALEPEAIETQALATDRGFGAYMESLERFKRQVNLIAESGVGLIAAQKGLHDVAEERLTAAGCIVLRRLGVKDIAQVAEHTGARVLKRDFDALTALPDALGYAESVEVSQRHGIVCIEGGKGSAAATVIVGAATREVAEEVKRIAEDACGALQSALRAGAVAGGGAVEVGAARAVRVLRGTQSGMASYGLDCVETALKRPLAQIVANAGYNPLEKVEMVGAAQESSGLATLAVDCSTGQVVDMLEAGVLDSAGVKLRALQTAGEVAEAILKISAIVRRRNTSAPEHSGGDEV
ncbi:MAG: TCP-1/cpn60 chaperonin family protein [Armatimonadetes bacterium]|nr:TCP-1/cpn60 chaperonin family protein [Armatimonadota bacterium]